MATYWRHLPAQGPVLASFGRTLGLTALERLRGRGAGGGAPGEPPVLRATVPPRSDRLVDDFIAWAGEDPAIWRSAVPPTLFPQWGMPLMARALEGLPFPLTRVLNAGCALTIHAPVPRGEPLSLSAQLRGVDETERRVLARVGLETRDASGDLLLESELQAIVPLRRGGGLKKRKAEELVPEGARELARWRLSRRAGLEFACLTGDFNPVHWVGPYAKLSGFRSVILHGFGSCAKAAADLVRSELDGNPARLKHLEMRFTKPLALPREVAVFLDGDRLLVADEVGEAPFLDGRFEAA
ncbi:MAG: MaoC/PaaZ C-terminal domain-containing protein [Deltaproteobacteria bacterium]|nr:MaoC/PaaZ C-terminal domain-containing protein [Deltaproteobacteria bacterium]